MSVLSVFIKEKSIECHNLVLELTKFQVSNLTDKPVKLYLKPISIQTHINSRTKSQFMIARKVTMSLKQNSIQCQRKTMLSRVKKVIFC